MLKSIEWLNQYREIQNAIKLLKWDIERINLELKRWDVDGDLYLNHDAEASRKERKKLKKVLLRQQKSLIELEQLKERLLAIIDMFEDVDNKILKLKYVDGMILDEVAKHLGYSDQYVYNRHASIMRTLNTASKLANLISEN